jgi:phosphoribosyl 1,2-cyclic phosphodiesterase
MRVISLQSGSNGNCVYVEACGVRLLVDAGIPAIAVRRRLAQYGLDPQGIDGVLISHDHVDHSRAMGVYQREFGAPIHVTAATLRAARGRCSLGAMEDVRHFVAGTVLQWNGVRVETVPTPHDGADGVGFVIDDGDRRLGILTDLGHVFDGLKQVVSSLDAVLLESNYDAEMLTYGRYPEFLKRRIRGPGGHLSNLEAAELLGAAASSRLRWACLAHLSGDNNSPEVALQTHRDILGDRWPLHVATRYEASAVLEM